MNLDALFAEYLFQSDTLSLSGGQPREMDPPSPGQIFISFKMKLGRKYMYLLVILLKPSNLIIHASIMFRLFWSRVAEAAA